MRSITFEACFSDSDPITNVNNFHTFRNGLQYVRVFHMRELPPTKAIGIEILSLLPSAKSVTLPKYLR